MKLEDKVIKIVVDSLHRSESEVKLTSHFINDLGADSLDTAELMMAVEDAFKDYIKETIPETDAEKFDTVGSVVEYLRSKGVPDEVK